MGDRRCWLKSTYSGNEGGDCVEVSTSGDETVHVRDSYNRTGAVIGASAEAWTALIDFVAGHGSEV
ncbi:DUF397 domain-containing protein [Streptomyces sp. NPDC003077]|uniref:DUF397 domain-containing protein n=1 Tax=Streptomyces sp. NPDC003077 TaxID=3154443 RepID=UPI0033AA4A8C